MEANNTILIIEDDAGVLELLAEIMEECGYQPFCVQTAKDAIAWLKINHPFIMILDYSLPDMNAKEFITELIGLLPVLPPFVVSTGQGDERIAVEMMKLGARDYIIKDSHFLNMIPLVITKVSRAVESENKLRLAELALVESNQFNKQIIKGAQEGIIVYDLELRYKVWNPFMENLTGISESTVLGKKPFELFPFLAQAGVQTHLENALNGKFISEMDVPFNFPETGKSGWASDTTAPLFNTAGQIIGAITTVRDITERKKAEQELKESEEKHRTLFETMAQGVVYQDKNGLIINANKASEKILGLSLEQMQGLASIDPRWKSIHEDGSDFHGSTHPTIIALQTGKPVYNTIMGVFNPITNDHKWININAVPQFRVGESMPYQVFATFDDFTDRKRTELALQESEEKHRAMIANISDVIAIIDKNGINTYKSPNIEKLFGWKSEDLTGVNTFDRVHPDDLERISENFNELLLQPNATRSGEVRYQCKDGTYKWIELTATNQLHNPIINGLLLNYHDITERKRTEVELLEREINYTGLFNTVQQAIYIQNPDGTFIDVNQGAVDMYGYEREFFVCKTPEVLSAPGKNDMNKLGDTINAAFAGEPQKYEFWGIKKDGTVFLKEVWTVKGRYFGKEVLITLATDITERKKTETALKEREAEYRGLYTLMRLMSDTMPDMLWAKDLENHYIFANKAICENLLSATDTSEPIGKEDLFFALREREAHKDDPNWHTFGEICRDTDTITLQEMREMQFDEYGNVKGKFIFLDVHKAPLYDNAGQLIGVVGSGRDITLQKQAEAELIIAKEKAEASEHKVRSMFENTLTGFLFFTAQGEVLEANPAAIRLLGSPSMEATRQINVLNFKPLIDIGFTGEVIRCINEKKVITNELLYTSRWGKTVYSKYFLIPIITQNEVTGVWANLQDLTDLWQTQTDLTTAKEKAEEGDKLKTAFLNNISHEIRTPMNAIIGFSEFLVSETEHVNKREKFAQLVQSGCNQLLDIVTNIVEISQVQANQVKIVEKEIDLDEIFEEVYSQFKKEAWEKNLDLIFEIDLQPYQTQALSDGYKITKILNHLVNNALKFTHLGHVKINCLLSKLNEYEFTVSDSGIGISSGMLQKILEPFRQVEIDLTRNFGGNGIGLSIAKAYIELLGGKLNIHSEVNKGTVIKFTIPYKPINSMEQMLQNKITEINLSNKVILVAEDEFSNFLLIDAILSNSNATILHAKNGIEAIDSCRNNSKIDIILMDIKMPRMDGHSAAKLIKEFRPDLPIIAQTAYALESEKEQFIGVFDDYITKPIKKEELKQKLMQHVKDLAETY